MKHTIRKGLYLGVVLFFLAFVFSCEEDFTDIGSNVISNTKFDTNAVEYEIVLENSPLERVQSDNISRQLGQYLLGVYNNADYEKLEASIVSQVGVVTGLKVVNRAYGSDTTVVTKLDTAFIKIPYQVTLPEGATSYELDSIFGDATKAFNVNVYRSNTFINQFDPSDPTKTNSYFSDAMFEKLGNELNANFNYQLTPSKNDTLIAIKRRLFDDSVARIDTFRLTLNNSNIPIPFARIPLDEQKIKELFLDKYESSEFASQSNFNDYLRGIILEATGNEGALLSLDFNNANSTLIPSIDIHYTNTILKAGVVVDTIAKFNSFRLTGFRVNTYNMDNRTYPNDEIKIQGTAGSEGKIQLLTQAELANLRSKNWLINDASISFYINQSADTTNIPSRLFLYKNYTNGSSSITSQIKDAITEASFGGIDGALERDANGKAEKYTFKITDYMSDIISGEINFLPELKLKAFNPSDNPIVASDTIFRNFSWSSKAVTLYNHLSNTKKPTIKISYSEKK